MPPFRGQSFVRYDALTKRAVDYDQATRLLRRQRIKLHEGICHRRCMRPSMCFVLRSIGRRLATRPLVVAYPGQVTRVRAQFSTAGQFVWHCYIVEHEDNEMMRPYRIGPLQPGQPI